MSPHELFLLAAGHLPIFFLLPQSCFSSSILWIRALLTVVSTFEVGEELFFGLIVPVVPWMPHQELREMELHISAVNERKVDLEAQLFQARVCSSTNVCRELCFALAIGSRLKLN